MDLDTSIPTEPAPSAFNYVLSFLLVGVAWGFTTPFIRRAAADFTARQKNNAAHTHGPSQTQDPAQLGSEDVGKEQELLSGDKRESEGVRKRRGSQQQSVDADADTETKKDMHTSEWKQPQQSWLRTQSLSLFWTVVNLLRTPAYSVPLVVNLTGSVWFFLLVGKHELSLTVPLANSSAFLFTVLGEWYVERKVIAQETWLGMFLVLGGIAVCVHSKNQTG